MGNYPEYKEYITNLDRDLYYEEGGTPKVRGTAEKLWEHISNVAKGNVSNVPFKIRWVAEKLASNYQSWKDLSTKERIPLIRGNLASLIKELQKKPSQ